MISSYQELNLRITYEAENNWSVGAYVENLNNAFTYDGLNNNGGMVPSHFFGPRRPRTAGVRFGYSWD
jgi:iron complex outermembrane receptor protein